MPLPVAAQNKLEVAAASMLDSLIKYLPAPVQALPLPTVSVVKLEEKAVGLGGIRSSDVTGVPGSTMRRGIRLNALTRFQVWAPAANDVDQAIRDLNMLVLGDRANLWAEGFLRLVLEDTPLSMPVGPPDGPWRAHADFRVLYEFDFEDTAGAGSIIAQVPVAINGSVGETMTLTDDMARWDNVSAPKLVERGQKDVAALSMLAFIPQAPPNGKVTMRRTFDGATGNPASYATLAEFLTAISGPNPRRNATVTFASFNNFMAAFQDTGDSIAVGDWDGDGVADQYRSLVLSLNPAITLAGVKDRFEVTYGATKFNQVAVAYLRANVG